MYQYLMNLKQFIKPKSFRNYLAFGIHESRFDLKSQGLTSI